MSKANKRKSDDFQDELELLDPVIKSNNKKNENGDIKNIRKSDSKMKSGKNYFDDNGNEQKIKNILDEYNESKKANNFQKENEKLNKENGQLKEEIKELKKENKELKTENNKLKKENEKLKNENDFLKLQQKENDKEDSKKKQKDKQNLSQNKNNKNNNNIFDFNNINNNIDKLPKNEKKEKFIETIPELKVLQAIKDYPRPPLIGLQNIGATCFMNSTLQCLSQTKGLTNYFLKDSNIARIINNNIALFNPREYQLAPVYHELIQNLWRLDGQKYYAPYNFMKRVNDMNPLFKKGEAGDAKDFIIFVLEQMHKELNKSLKIKKINEGTTLNQYDKNNTLMNFFNEFTENTSIISDLFFGFNETTNICLYCKNYYRGVNYPICYNYGIFNVLIFPLEEVKNMKNNNMMMNLNNFYQGPSNVVNIDDCFIYNQKTDLFTGENKNYCNLCKQLAESHYTSKIYVSPNILILILNRGKNNIYKVKMDFRITIDITNYVIQKDKPRIMYNLYGVITHLGESGPNAHFVATCKSPVDGNWYRYNDAIVEQIVDFNRDVYNFGNPYILFYEKVN